MWYPAEISAGQLRAGGEWVPPDIPDCAALWYRAKASEEFAGWTLEQEFRWIAFGFSIRAQA